MRILLIRHESSLCHDSGPGHPERPERLAAVVAGVGSAGFEVIGMDAPIVDRSDLALVHEQPYIDAIERFCSGGGGYLDADTHLGSDSWEAALRSAGAGAAAVSALEQGKADGAFVAMRPPGHHALPDRAMGFCVFNNIAILAASLAAADQKVAIVDWDVHHGNGTQDMFYEDDAVLYISLHESPFYPGTGHLHERGAGDGLWTTLNMPLPAGTSGDVYQWLVGTVVVPSIADFEPDWLLVSAGYDAHRSDPLASVCLESEDYGAMAAALSNVVAGARTVFFLEGGYDLDALEASTRATIRGLFAAGEPPPVPTGPGRGAGWDQARRAAEVLSSKQG